ncbi:MAG TPA: hypothetical protein VLK85_16220 [Ramlibacter sp.]|nr:hypothetical protein [Ramlibacter sp.]
MHTLSCPCAKCQSARDRTFSVERFGAAPRVGAVSALKPLSEAEEMELAMELLSVSSEAEWEQFLGKMFRGIGRGLKKVGKFVGGKILKPLGGALKGLAKKALPLVGGALGSFIPIPGVGTAIGSALGSAVSKALELEFGELESEEAEFEIARRFVRIAASAAQQASGASPAANPESVVRDALLAAARAHVPSFAANEAQLVAEAEWETQGEGGYEAEAGGGAMAGRWQRRGRQIVVHGA